MKTILAIYLMLTAFNTAVLANHVIDEAETPQFLFVLNAGSGSFDGDTLTLTGVPPVIYFSDRPYRIAGNMGLEKFAEFWREGANDFATDPPNATLSFLNESGDNNVVIELLNAPEISGDSVVFQVRVLLGDLPDAVPTSSLFVDMLTSNIKTPGVY